MPVLSIFTPDLPHLLVLRLCLLLPYASACQALSRLWSQGLFREVVCPKEWRRFRRDFGSWAGPPGGKSGVFLRQMQVTRLASPRLKELNRWEGPDRWPGWLTIDGFERVRRLNAKGRKIVIVNSHYGAFQCVPLLLCRLGLRLGSIECADIFAVLKLRRPEGLTIIPTAGEFLARPALRAKRFLNSERLLCIAADGYIGTSGLKLSFHGRRRLFASGFADLAVDGGAEVIPVMAPVDDFGRVRIEFLDPLDSGTSPERRQRVESLIRQYARLLEERWSEDPGNIFNMVKFISLPPAGAEGGNGEQRRMP
jgi:predicted LPLAT superfamily acyltransferase